MNSYKFLEIQVAIFFNGVVSGRPDLMSVEINGRLGHALDAQPLILPLPDDAPSMIPFLQAKSRNGVFQCNVSKARADFFYFSKGEDRSKSFADNKKTFENYVDVFFDVFANKISIKRIGYIAKFFIPDSAPALTIKEKLFQLDVGIPHEANIRYNLREAIEGFEVNNITQIDPADILDSKEKGILVQKDINTIAEKNYSFDKVLFKKFQALAEHKFDISQLSQRLISHG